MKWLIALCIVNCVNAAERPLSAMVDRLESRFNCKINYPSSMRYRKTNFDNFISLKKSLSKIFASESYSVTSKDGIRTVNVSEKRRNILGDFGKSRIVPVNILNSGKKILVDKKSLLLSFDENMSKFEKQEFCEKNDLQCDELSLDRSHVLVRVKRGVSKELMKNLTQKGKVKASYNHVVRTASTDLVGVNLAQVIIEDQFYDKQWGHQVINGHVGYLDQKAKLIKVVVLDTGVNLSHEDLSSSKISNRDFSDHLLTDSDNNGHGSGVIGVISASWNGKGISGLTGADTISVKVFDH
ncbi:S8 family serine peptidase [bacterium]|nr:S8 family serine peptidase [bacterium]